MLAIKHCKGIVSWQVELEPKVPHQRLKFSLSLIGAAPYIRAMSRNQRGRPVPAPPGFIQPCGPTVARLPPVGRGWLHELKHDGYRLQVHVRDGRVRLFTMNGNNWTDRYPRIVEEAARRRWKTGGYCAEP
jgi:ATP-dependent DNA ligase